MQLNSTMNVPAMQAQESKDFTVTKAIMNRIFKTYKANVKMTQTPPYSPYDGNMTVTKDNVNSNYIVEIKERNTDNAEYLPLTCKKYCTVMENAINGTPLVVYLVNNERYYIFDLNKLNLNLCKIKFWKIKKVQYSDNEEMIKTPTIFIPQSECCYQGIILETDADNL